MAFDKTNEFGWKPLIELQHAAGVAAICSDPDGSLWLARLADDLGVDDEHFDDGDEPEDSREELAEMLDGIEIAGQGDAIENVSVLGGRLPDGAITVRVDARLSPGYAVVAGDGLWLAAVEVPGIHFRPSVTFWNGQGEPVVVPLPEHVELEPIRAEDIHCPVCGATSWMLASVPHRPWTEGDDLFFDNWSPGRRDARCDCCGHSEQLASRMSGDAGTLYVKRQDIPEEEAHRRRASARSEAWSEFLALNGAKPIGLEPDTWTLGRARAVWLSPNGDGVSEVYMSYESEDRATVPYVHVRSSGAERRNDPWSVSFDRDTDRMDLAATVRQLRHGERDYASDDPALELREALEQRAAERELASLAEAKVEMSVDGNPVEFTILEHELCWIAKGRIGGLAIAMDGAGVGLRDLNLVQTDATSAED